MSQPQVYIYPLFVTTERWVEFPVAYSRFSLVIYFIHSIYGNPNLPIHLTPLLSPWCSYICSLCLYFCFANRFICFHIYVLMYDICFFSFWLTSLWMTVSGSIHVSTSGTISVLFMAEWYSSVYKCTSLSIPLLMDVQVASMCWLRYFMPQWTLGCMYRL